jgi:hypothetical protein
LPISCVFFPFVLNNYRLNGVFTAPLLAKLNPGATLSSFFNPSTSI